MAYFLGLDLGTTAAKAVLIDAAGTVLGSAAGEYPLSSPRPLWAEQNPEDWWNAARNSFRGTLQQAGIKPGQVEGIGLTGQMHGLVLLDKDGRALRPCIMWNDQRTAAQCEAITRRIGFERLLEITGNAALPGFTAPKILWVQENEPEIYQKTARILLPKDYIRYRLTGEFATDVSDASGTLLLDVQRRNWSGEILSALDIPASRMPKVYESPEITGAVSEIAAKEAGLQPGIPVVGGGGDQAAGGVGTGTVLPGIVSVSLGTSGVVFSHTDQPAREPQGRLHAFCHAVPGAWHVMGVTLAAGGSLRWFREVFGEPEQTLARQKGVDPYELLSAEAQQAPPGSEGLLYLPYLSGERTPYPDPLAKGVFLGMTLRHRKAHFVRAVLEGVAYSLKDCLEMLRSIGLEIRQVRVSGGGARSELWRQILADVFAAELATLNSTEGAPYGAALLAAVGAGAYPTVQEACRSCIKIVRRVEPAAERVKVYQDFYGIYRSLYQTLKDSFKAISGAVDKYSR